MTGMISPTQLYQQAVRSAGEGRIDSARRQIEEFLKARPTYGPGWHLAGRLAMQQGDFRQAVQCFQRCLSLLDGPKETPADLASVWLKLNRPDEAVRLFRMMRNEGCWNDSLVLEAAGCFLRRQEPASAMEAFQMGRAVSKTPSVYDEPIEQLKVHRPKIAFFCGADGDTFLKPILSYLQQRYPIRVFSGSRAEEIRSLMDWSDISWFEWASNLAQIGTNLPKTCRIIVRLHRYEAYLPWPKQIHWPNVDVLVTVGNSYVLRALEHWVPDIRKQTAIIRIPNGVDVDAIPFVRREKGKNIAFIANLRLVKNPMFLLQCMYELHQIDPEYHLHIAGKLDDLLLKQYLEHQVRILGLEKVVHVHGWVEDIDSWLADKHYLVSASVIESQGMGILEAMASGLKPVIHHFPGADEIYDSQFLFRTAEEFCGQMLSDVYEPNAYREFVERRYPLIRTLRLVDELLASFENQPFKVAAEQTGASAVCV
ncbi:MAG TPA: glycosyltransferase [Anaerohalosphaeraceae bacterium]|nr:glycosyltransferase [Anaerohalosphaeraceae bacterium]HOL87667.1 glycosyltransferase [Anaerohalosphaeraceae bacterium]HPP55825.1 glycosyltransferase [Anaerohalosphaeraceae bacterium]